MSYFIQIPPCFYFFPYQLKSKSLQLFDFEQAEGQIAAEPSWTDLTNSSEAQSPQRRGQADGWEKVMWSQWSTSKVNKKSKSKRTPYVCTDLSTQYSILLPKHTTWSLQPPLSTNIETRDGRNCMDWVPLIVTLVQKQWRSCQHLQFSLAKARWVAQLSSHQQQKSI